MAQARRILVVDDKEVVREVLVEILHWLGYEVEAVSSGEKALAIFDEAVHALLIIDQHMPGMQGTELVSLLRQRCPSLPAVAVTASEAKEELLKAGVLEIIQKPFDIGQIRKAVERAMEKVIMPPRTFYCPVGIAFDIPVEWEVSGFQGTEAHFKVPDETGVRRDVLSLSVLSAESNTLGLALDEVRREAWRACICNAEPVRLGKLEALCLELT